MNSNNFCDILLASTNVDKIETMRGISENILGEYYLQEYYKILEYGIISFLLCSVLGLLAYIFSLNSVKDVEKLSEYECGFEPFDSATRLPFDVHFYVVGILFLIFDVEVAVLFPWVLGLKFIGYYGYYTMMLFLFVLTIGFIYEWQRGALTWPASQATSKQYSLNSVGLVFTGADLSNTEITTAFFESINKYITYTTHLDLTHILGEVFLASFLCFAFVFVAVTAKHLDNNSKRVFAVYINNFAILGLIITSLLFIETLLTVSTANPLFAMSIIVDYYSLFIKLLINASVIFILTSSHYYLISRQNSNPEFSLIILLATLFLLVLVSAFNLFTAFMCIIGFSITLYVLVLSDLVEHTKREATIKYYYLSVYSSGFLIFGIFLLYLVSNSLNYINIKVFLNNLILAVNYQSMDILNTQVILIIIMIALISQLIGILFKLSAFPCHFWAPEVYDGSPNLVTAYFLLPVKIAVFAFFFRLFLYALAEVGFLWQLPLMTVSITSMIYGCLTAVNELKIKRFIAYTSINQIGFLIIGITCNSFAGFQSSLIYLLIYIIMNVVFLIIFLNTYNFKIFKELKYFSEFKYLKFTNTTQIFYFTAVIFSMAGIPPFAGFFGKFFLLLEAFNSTLYSVVIVALVTSLISAYYYIRIIKITFFETTFSNTNLINYTNSFYTNVSNFCYNLLFFSPFKNNLIIKKKKMMSNFFMCLIASKNFSTLWFKTFYRFNNSLYYILIFFLLLFVFFTPFVYKISFLIIKETYLPLTQIYISEGVNILPC